MKRFIAWVCIVSLVVVSMAGCGKSEPEGIVIQVDGYDFGFAVTEVGPNDEGKTTVKLQMEPVEGAKGKELADAMQIMQVATMFLITPYIVVDGERLDASNDNSKAGLGGKNEDGKLISNYTFTFDTDQTPDELWLAPKGREDETDWHYQIDPKNYSIIKNPEIAE